MCTATLAEAEVDLKVEPVNPESGYALPRTEKEDETCTAEGADAMQDTGVA